MKPVPALLLLAATTLIAGCGANSADSAARLTDAFYRQHQALSPAGSPGLKGLLALRPYLSVSLFESLKDVAAADENSHAADAPPLLTVDPFTAQAQNLISFKVGDCKVEHAEAACPVEITVDASDAAPKMTRTDRAVLQQDARGWVLDDIEFGQTAGTGAAPARPSAAHMLADALERNKKR